LSRPALSWLSAACLAASVAACGPSKPVGLGEVDVDAGAGEAAAGATCVRTSVLLPWPASEHPALEVVAGEDAIAVLNRQADGLEAHILGPDGAPLGAGTFGPDTQVLAAPGGGFDVVARTDEGGDWVEATFNARLTSGTPGFAVSATPTERALAALALPTATVLVTDERFINMATGMSATWSAVLDGAGAQALEDGRLYGLTAQDGNVLLAWGAQNVMGMAVMDTSAHVVRQGVSGKASRPLGGETTTALPFDGGLLLFDGNPVSGMHLDFTFSMSPLAPNQQLRAYDEAIPRVASVVLGGLPVAFWLSVFPSTGNTSASASHQLYGCALDLAAGRTCASTALVATTDLRGDDVAAAPLAAAAMPDGTAFAIVHTDARDATWLRVADLSCAQPR
jgi:hypothetical protein